MFHDARSVPRDTRLEADVCIVGAGAAGITLALELAPTKLSVAVLESGGLEFDAQTQALCRGEVVARPYFSLDTTRLRLFGGSTNHWGGKCRPLDASDFRTRAWIPHSGWPFGREELLPFYERAQRVCRLGPFEYEPGFWEARLGTRAWPLDPSVVRSRVFQIRPLRFGPAYRDRLARAPRVSVYLHANATRLDLDPGGGLLDRAQVRTLDGNRFTARARVFVLAAGGLENPRLLLASSHERPRGLGNQHDLVGRFFMDHLWCPWGRLRLSDPGTPSGLYAYDYAPSPELRIHAALSLSDAVMEAEGLSNFAAVPLLAPGDGDPAADPGTPGAPLAGLAAHMDAGLDAGLDAGRETGPLRAGSGHPVREVELANFTEQVPNPDSRVTLGGERDALGQPRLRLAWRLSELDKRSLRRAHERLALEVGRSGLGRLRLDVTEDPGDWPRAMNGGHHHMGTTRMHADERRGVVDGHGRVHGVPNLYVAGSSLFPTSGYANPTLTLVALALRLADRLRTRLR